MPPKKQRSEFAAVMYAVRRKNKLTQAQAAPLVGLSLPQYKCWETGKTIPNAIKQKNALGNLSQADRV
jgi:DNA-binding XRE family transcriptional regulator